MKPCLPTAQSLIAAVNSNHFHFTWVLALLNKTFLHESKFLVRWAVRTFLTSQLHLQTTDPINLNYMNRFIMGPLMIALQKSFLYHKAEDNEFVDHCPQLAIQLSDFFKSYVNAMTGEQVKTEFLEQFTATICQHTWSPMSLLFLSNVLLTINPSVTLNAGIFIHLTKILTWCTSTHEVFIRSTIQTNILNSLINNFQVNQLVSALVIFN